ncbi:MAG: hypothetical protein NT092_11305 [Bacteroidia bacterium]|nr:hypothetical protein [Bacteroidia bacterium]
MRKFLILIIAIFFLSSVANAQLWKLRRYEIAAGIGTTQFFGDIGGFSRNENILGLKDITFHHTRMNLSAAMRYRILDDVSVRLNLALGYFHSTDARGSNQTRGFESNTIFFEPALIGEYYFIKNTGENSYTIMRGKTGASKSFLSMLDFYGFAGIGGLSYNVSPNELLKSEGLKQHGFTAVIPAGVGVTLIYSGMINFGLELGGRYSFSDYLDGYTSQNLKSNDIYYFLNFTFTYKLKTGENGLPSF